MYDCVRFIIMGSMHFQELGPENVTNTWITSCALSMRTKTIDKIWAWWFLWKLGGRYRYCPKDPSTWVWWAWLNRFLGILSARFQWPILTLTRTSQSQKVDKSVPIALNIHVHDTKNIWNMELRVQNHLEIIWQTKVNLYVSPRVTV